MNNENSNTLLKKAKSEKLGREELKALRLYRKTFKTEVACAAEIGIERSVLNRISLVGSGSPDYVAKIREALYQQRQLIEQEAAA